MNGNASIPQQTHASRYEAVLRISEALSACREPEELTRILSEHLRDFLHFFQFYIVVYKENSTEIEWAVVGSEKTLISAYADVPVQERPSWRAYAAQEPFHIADWDSDERVPERLKQGIAAQGLRVGPLVFVPLTTPHRRLGALGMSGSPGTTYSGEDIAFLSLIGRVVAFAIDDNFNLRQAEVAQAELQRQNERLVIQNSRLQLLLKLTEEITSNLELRVVLRAISACIREVMNCDAVHISIKDWVSGQYRMFALDFPESKGFFREELIIEPAGAGKRALETLQPAVRNTANPDEFPPGLYKLMLAEGLKTQCVIPLVGRGRVVGVLAISRRTDDPFLPDEIDFLKEASGQIAIAIENCLAFQEISELKEKLAQEKLYLEEEIRSDMGFEQIVGNSPPLKRVLQLVESVAASDSTVLLLGETGTGKELIARAIHNHSGRKDRTFVKLNCAAIPTGLLESELFGHEKGAFTGAITQRIGRLELADQGTLFLDEIGDIPLEVQPKLLRALQEQEFERLGSTHTRKVNVRLVAATNRDLETMIAAREFRSDLYYRLNVFPIRIPPLRERKQDIALLVSYFVQKFSKQMQKKIEGIPAAVMKALTAWPWPGNVRELENFIERAVILSRGTSLAAPLAELRKVNSAEPKATPANHDEIARIVKETINVLHRNNSATAGRFKRERDEIVRALTEAKGRVGGADGAAARMRVNRTTLLARMKKLRIDPHDYT